MKRSELSLWEMRRGTREMSTEQYTCSARKTSKYKSIKLRQYSEFKNSIFSILIKYINSITRLTWARNLFVTEGMDLS